MISSAGYRFRAALGQEKPLQVAGCINAYSALLAERIGFRALYLSGGGVSGKGRFIGPLSMRATNCKAR